MDNNTPNVAFAKTKPLLRSLLERYSLLWCRNQMITIDRVGDTLIISERIDVDATLCCAPVKPTAEITIDIKTGRIIHSTIAESGPTLITYVDASTDKEVLKINLPASGTDHQWTNREQPAAANDHSDDSTSRPASSAIGAPGLWRRYRKMAARLFGQAPSEHPQNQEHLCSAKTPSPAPWEKKEIQRLFATWPSGIKRPYRHKYPRS